jgi:hypothetical protein
MFLTQVQAAMPADYITVSDPPSSVTVGDDGYATINVTVQVTHITDGCLPIEIEIMNETYKQILFHNVIPEIDWINGVYKDYSMSIGFRMNKTGPLHFYIRAISNHNNLFTNNYTVQVNSKPVDGGNDPLSNTTANASLIFIIVIVAVIGTIISWFTYKAKRQRMVSRQSGGAEIRSGETEINIHF